MNKTYGVILLATACRDDRLWTRLCLLASCVETHLPAVRPQQRPRTDGYSFFPTGDADSRGADGVWSPAWM
jgi:hypothetical protein